MNNIGQRIYELRQKENISQDALAELLGVSRQAVSKWENAQSVPEIEKVVQMSEIFRVSTDYILKGKEPEENEPVRNSSSAAGGYSQDKLRQIMGIMLTVIGMIGILLGFVFSSRVVFQLSPLFIIFGLMFTYIKRNALLWCLGTITVLTFLFGRNLVHPFVYFILLSIEIISIAIILVVKMK